ncbi:MAG: hypothetical protein DI598_01085 [Pseudopedobacter saltans]|uniref:Uncharacterized protein n=1 Tax=Pseudopedobacter saltans TaxID=151895 RepID=A0A2W5FF02_9SPHI|nr:MAG: hypothetical protein DI598_01085 [Pseudopedobacter saltans]
MYQVAQARRVRVRNSSYYAYKLVADLPNTPEYLLKEGDGKTPNQYMDLAIETVEYGLNKTIPMWVKSGPKLVGYNEALQVKVDLTEEGLNEIISENHLNKDKLLSINLYRRYGYILAIGLLILVAILAIGHRNVKSRSTNNLYKLKTI